MGTTADDLRREIAATKSQRLRAWQRELPKDIAERPVEEQQRLAREAEQSPKVRAYDDALKTLRAQLDTALAEEG